MMRSAATLDGYITMSEIARVRKAPSDPHLPGTAKNRWESELSAAPTWRPEEGPLLVVSPRPEDEIFAAGGLVSTWCTLGYPVTVVSVTDGEASYPDWVGREHIRRREFVEALRLLCEGPVSVVHLGLPDGKVHENVGTLFSALSRLLSNEPTLIAPYEWNGHPDHDVTGAVCRELARLHRLPIARFPNWTWHHAEPEVFAGEHIGRFVLTPAVRQVKAAAIQAFASQPRPPNRQPTVPGQLLPYFMRNFEAFLLD